MIRFYLEHQCTVGYIYFLSIISFWFTYAVYCSLHVLKNISINRNKKSKDKFFIRVESLSNCEISKNDIILYNIKYFLGQFTY